MRSNTVIWHDSPEAYHSYLSSIPRQFIALYDDSYDFRGGSYEQNLERLRIGDRTNLELAQKIMDQMHTQQVFSIGSPVLVPSVVGFIPNIPNYLAGVPQDMYNIEIDETPSPTSPIKIFVETTVSAMLTQKELTARGVAALALTLALSMTRPVQLYTATFGCYNDWNGTVHGSIVPVMSNPIDLDRAVYMLTHSGFNRALAFPQISYQHNPKSARYTSIPFPRNCRDICQCEPEDILIKGGHAEDTLMLNDPVAWVKQQLEKHGAPVQQ